NGGYPEVEANDMTSNTATPGDGAPTGQAEQVETPEADTTAEADLAGETGEGGATTQTDADGQQEQDFPVLAVGTIVMGRYEVTELISDEAHEHVYHVVDHQGYQRCWSCGFEQNGEGDEFCGECGASLLNAPYIMHEYSAQESAGDAPVMQGNIVNTFVDQGRTYAIEQPQAEQSAFPNGVCLESATASDAGNVRRSDPNEDSTLVMHFQRIHESISSPVGAFIVADGMGGHDNGQGASRITINVIAERLARELLLAPLTAEKDGQPAAPFDEDALVLLLHGAVEDANNALCQKNAQEKSDMGSTLTGCMVVGEHAYIVNVGDSRTYMLRNKQLYQVTTDHSLVAQLVASGLIEPDDVYTHPQRSQIFRSLGDKTNLQIDIFKQQLLPGDILLSCCDGLWEMVRNPQIESILNNAPDPQTACAQLIEAANTGGGEDNISAVVVFVR
ncbi:MAG TPA: protein phosphatase 2C domain-containing protein, partial [Ktedonobacteraceae bacterium]|nr:protein phosphatase 2C domain-containing protein [Ktedonobacteraceae bacterium]